MYLNKMCLNIFINVFVKVLECIKHYNKSLKELASEIKLYPQVLKNVQVTQKPDFNDIPEIKDSLVKIEKELGNKVHQADLSKTIVKC